MPRLQPISARSLLSLLPLALWAGGCGPTEPSDPPRPGGVADVWMDPPPIGVVADDAMDPPPLKTCTAMLRIQMARLVDACGRPVEGASVVVSDSEGRTRTVDQVFPPEPGLYTVFTDGVLPLDPGGTRITARFSKDGKVHAEEYRLSTDGCHFLTLSAPDTVRTGW